MQVYYPSDRLQTTFSSVPDTNNIPTSSTSVSTSSPTTTDSSSSTSSGIVTQASDFFQDNSTYIFIGLGVAILLFTMRK